MILNNEHIDKLINIFLEDTVPTERNASFDYCYNYFQNFRISDKIPEIAVSENLQVSCLQLGFYLASWGMLRPKGFLFQKSIKHYEPLIKEIANFDTRIWSIDVDSYTKDNIRIILDCYQRIVKAFIPNKERAIVIATKIMLGVFGCVPAFDDNFRKGFREIFKGKCGFTSLNIDSLNYVKEFYQSHKQSIDGWSDKIKTIDFKTGEYTNLSYPKAKIIDMIGFTFGFSLSLLSKKKGKI